MKRFKIVDCTISMLLIIYIILKFAAEPSPVTVWIGLFIIGIWHIISMLVHYFNTPLNTSSDEPVIMSRIRSFYHYTSLVSIIPVIYLLTISSPAENFLPAFLKVLFPISLSFFYTGLCLYETFNWIKHENK